MDKNIEKVIKRLTINNMIDILLFMRNGKNRERNQMKERNINELLKFKRTPEGYYEKEMNDLIYSVRRNEESSEWHLYVNNEWHLQVENCKMGKLTAIAESLNIDY